MANLPEGGVLTFQKDLFRGIFAAFGYDSGWGINLERLPFVKMRITALSDDLPYDARSFSSSILYLLVISILTSRRVM